MCGRLNLLVLLPSVVHSSVVSYRKGHCIVVFLQLPLGLFHFKLSGRGKGWYSRPLTVMLLIFKIKLICHFQTSLLVWRGLYLYLTLSPFWRAATTAVVLFATAGALLRWLTPLCVCSQTPSRDLMLNDFFTKKTQMVTVMKNAEDLEKMKRSK